ncbi:MAG: hypothetical protein V4696_03615 [Pseudomonadota bacterium]
MYEPIVQRALDFQSFALGLIAGGILASLISVFVQRTRYRDLHRKNRALASYLRTQASLIGALGQTIGQLRCELRSHDRERAQ